MAKNDFDELMSVGIDIGKDTFYIVAFAPDGQLMMRKQIKRLALVATFEKLPRCVVGMVACLAGAVISLLPFSQGAIFGVAENVRKADRKRRISNMRPRSALGRP